MTRLRYVFAEGFTEVKEELQRGLDVCPVPEYMHAAIREYVLDHQRPGDFLMAVLSNDLFHAVGKADSTNSKALRNWINLIYNYCPSECWGSINSVKEWIKNG